MEKSEKKLHFGGIFASKLFSLKQPLTKWVKPILPVSDWYNQAAQKSSPGCGQMLGLSLLKYKFDITQQT